MRPPSHHLLIGMLTAALFAATVTSHADSVAPTDQVTDPGSVAAAEAAATGMAVEVEE